MPQISVIISAFNAAPFLGRAITSVFKQTFDDWKIIIVDDGSTDNTYELASRHANEEKRITVIRQPNSGLPMARHTGVMASDTEFITFLDADDTLMPDALEKMVSAMKKEVDIAVFFTKDHEDLTAEEYVNKILRRQSNWNLWGKVYRRNLFDKDTLAIPHLNMAEDFVGNLRIMKNVKHKISFHPIRLYNYTVNASSLTSTYKRNLEDEFRIIKLVKEAVMELPFDASEGLWNYEIGMLGGFIAHGLPVDFNGEWVKSLENTPPLSYITMASQCIESSTQSLASFRKSY